MKDLNWSDPTTRDWDAYRLLCQMSKPSDFYFVAKEWEGYTMISIVPKAYFHNFGYMWDQSMLLDNILPDDFCESMESIWDTERDVKSVRADLLARGFEENEKFSELIQDYE